MSKLNLDETVNLNSSKDIIIAGKKYHIVFNDETSKILSDVTITLGSIFAQLTKETPDFENKMTIYQRKQYLSTQYHILENTVFPVFDNLFKQSNFGKNLFHNYCHKDIEVLLKIITILMKVQASTEFKVGE